MSEPTRWDLTFKFLGSFWEQLWGRGNQFHPQLLQVCVRHSGTVTSQALGINTQMAALATKSVHQ